MGIDLRQFQLGDRGHAVLSRAALHQAGDFAEADAEAVRVLDHPQQGDGTGRVAPVSRGVPVRTSEQSAAFVVAKRLHADLRGGGHLRGAAGSR